MERTHARDRPARSVYPPALVRYSGAPAVIRLRDVTMRYGPVKALDSASFELERGEIVGLLGPNGAGKTTSMRIVTTYLTPEAGAVAVDGIDALAHPLEVRRRVGYLPEVAPLYPDMQVRDFLRFVARARFVTDPARIDWVVDSCGLAGVFLKHIRELSRGYRQRVGLAQAMIHDPDVLILDEPTAGLDPFQVQVIRDLIRSLAGSKTILLSTHVLGEAELVTDRAIIIHRGRIVADGPLPDLERRARDCERVVAEVAAPLADVCALLEGLEGVLSVEDLGCGDGPARLEITAVVDTDLRARVGSALAGRSWTVTELREERFSLEETFMALTRGEENPS